MKYFSAYQAGGRCSSLVSVYVLENIRTQTHLTLQRKETYHGYHQVVKSRDVGVISLLVLTNMRPESLFYEFQSELCTRYRFVCSEDNLRTRADRLNAKVMAPSFFRTTLFIRSKRICTFGGEE